MEIKQYVVICPQAQDARMEFLLPAYEAGEKALVEVVYCGIGHDLVVVCRLPMFFEEAVNLVGCQVPVAVTRADE